MAIETFEIVIKGQGRGPEAAQVWDWIGEIEQCVGEGNEPSRVSQAFLNTGERLHARRVDLVLRGNKVFVASAPEPLEAIAFASPAAKALAVEHGLTPVNFDGYTPSGQKGYTSKDVRLVAGVYHT